MADAETLLAEFKATYEAGEAPDLAGTLERASPDERQALREKLDSYLMTAPRRAWDPVAYENSLAKLSVERVWESLEGVSGSWPQLLPHLRHKARLKRSEVVARLSEALGVTDKSQKVAGYYNQMEHGRLPARGISERVFDALAQILGTDRESLIAAGRAIAPPAGGQISAFARKAISDADYAAESLEEAPAATAALGAAPKSSAPARDEVDDLFTGA